MGYCPSAVGAGGISPMKKLKHFEQAPIAVLNLLAAIPYFYVLEISFNKQTG
jgi:hypothetical protein